MRKYIIGIISTLIILPTLFFSRDRIIKVFKAPVEIEALAEDYREFNDEYQDAYVQQVGFIQEQRVANQRYDSYWETQDKRWEDYKSDSDRQWQAIMNLLER